METPDKTKSRRLTKEDHNLIDEAITNFRSKDMCARMISNVCVVYRRPLWLEDLLNEIDEEERNESSSDGKHVDS